MKIQIYLTHNKKIFGFHKYNINAVIKKKIYCTRFCDFSFFFNFRQS